MTNSATSSGVAPDHCRHGGGAQGGGLAGSPTAADQQAAGLLEVEHRRVLRLGGRVVEHADRDEPALAPAGRRVLGTLDGRTT